MYFVSPGFFSCSKQGGKFGPYSSIMAGSEFPCLNCRTFPFFIMERSQTQELARAGSVGVRGSPCVHVDPAGMSFSDLKQGWPGLLPAEPNLSWTT